MTSVRALLGLALFASAAQAAAPPPSVAPRLNDHQDVLLLTTEGPLLIRLHLLVNNKPYHLGYTDYLRRHFAWLDRNGDGVLRGDEFTGRVFPGSLLVEQFRPSFSPSVPEPAKLSEVDRNGDGLVSLDEFLAYQHRTGFRPLEMRALSRADTANEATDLFYRLLDTNGDGKLSREELARAPAVLRRYDINADEYVSQEELTLGRSVYAGPEPSRPSPGTFALVVDESRLGVQIRQVVARYDSDRDGQLSREEVGLTKEVFDRLDSNRDGKLSPGELTGLVKGPPSLEVRINLGPGAGMDGVFRRLGIGAGPKRAGLVRADRNLTRKVKEENLQTLSLTSRDLTWLQADANARAPFNNARFFYDNQFRSADPGNKGVVERARAGSPTSFLQRMFPFLDRDGDGKLTRREFNDYLAMQVSGSANVVQLTITDLGWNIFEALDIDNDQKLSPRELANAWERLGPLARDSAGLARGDLVRRLTLVLGQGGGNFLMPPARRAASSAGRPPDWFARMDLNRDGEVSRDEFLGPLEVFRAIDTNGDGLISVAEALAYAKKKN